MFSKDRKHFYCYKTIRISSVKINICLHDFSFTVLQSFFAFSLKENVISSPKESFSPCFSVFLQRSSELKKYKKSVSYCRTLTYQNNWRICYYLIILFVLISTLSCNTEAISKVCTVSNNRDVTVYVIFEDLLCVGKLCWHWPIPDTVSVQYLFLYVDTHLLPLVFSSWKDHVHYKPLSFSQLPPH